VYAWDVDGQRAIAGGFKDGRIAQDNGGSAGFSPGPLIADLNGDGRREIVVGDNLFFLHARVLTPQDGNADSLADELFKLNVTGTGSTAPAISGSIIMYGDAEARLHLFGADGSVLDNRRLFADSTEHVVGMGAYPSQYIGIATGSKGTVALFADPRIVGPLPTTKSTSLGHALAAPAAVGDIGTPGASPMRIAVTTRDGLLFLLNGDLQTVAGFPVTIGDSTTIPPALGDLDGDGLRDIAVFSGNRICVYNPSGVMLDGFPVTLSPGDTLASAPILGDVDGNGTVDIVGVTHSGLVVAYDGHGKIVRGFPLTAGQGAQTAAMFTSADSVFLVVASSSSGSVSGWLTGRTAGNAQTSHYPWPQYQSDALHSGTNMTAVSGVPLANDFFPKNRAYNWPNPVYDRTTQIRYFVKEDARVHIKIFDLAGDLVTQFDGPGVGGRDNEAAWDVSSVQTGVYFARIEAAGTSATGNAVVKIAVVH
jgi:hypothetical protein